MDILEEEQIAENEYFDNDEEIMIIDTESESDEEFEVQIESDDDVPSDIAEQRYYNNLSPDNFDSIFQDEEPFMDALRVNGNYYIGLCGRPVYQSSILMLSCVSARSFLKYSLDDVLIYLANMSMTLWRGRPIVNILKLYIAENGEYRVVTKTFWLKIIQRKWKKIYKERCDIIRNMKSLIYLRIREMTGSVTYFPGIKGMYYHGNLNTLVK